MLDPSYESLISIFIRFKLAEECVLYTYLRPNTEPTLKPKFCYQWRIKQNV